MNTNSKPFKLTSLHIELAVVALLNYRIYTIVPNVSWGLGLGHECDLLCYKDEKFTEIEIKISMADLKKDFEKGHNHQSKYIHRLIYAFPESMLEKALPLIPESCGIILIRIDENNNINQARARWYRKCRYKHKNAIPANILYKFMSLGCMRIWSLKHHNLSKIKY